MNTLKTFMLAAATVATLAAYLPTATAAEEDAKAIHVREARATSGKPVQLNVSAVKKQYKVNEAIQFKVKGDSDYYLYVYSFDAENGKSTLLLPNQKVTANKFKAGKSYTLPSGIEFYSDAAGNENLMFIASTSKIDLSSARMQGAGNYQSGDTKDLEDTFSKTIRVRDAQPGHGSGSASLTIRIVE